MTSDTNATRRMIALEEIQALLVKHYPSTGAADKAMTQALVVKYFNTPSWTEMEKLMPLHDLQAGFDGLHRELEKQPSRYGVKDAAPATPDEIPFVNDNNNILDLIAAFQSATTAEEIDQIGIANKAVFDAASPADKEAVKKARGAAALKLAHQQQAAE